MHSCRISKLKLRHLLLLAAIAALTLLIPTAEAKPPKKDFLVLFDKRPAKTDKAYIGKIGGKVKKSFAIVPALSVELPEAAVEKLRKRKGVKAVEVDATVQAHDIQNTWGVLRIGCETLHDGTYEAGASPQTGSGVRVAVVDSGIDYSHPELLWNYIGGYDYVNNDADPQDDHGHGTHVAGTVAAIRDAVGVVGVAPEVDLYGVKVLGANGSGNWSWIISALDWCIANEIDVANFSLGSSSNPGLTVEAAFANAADAGVVLVASAGNSGAGVDTVGYPAKYSSVIAVASTTSGDARSSFSSTGPAVEIAAPGSSIYSSTLGGGYGFKSGTSMASPHVAGVAALLVGAGIVDADGDGRINDEVRLALQTTAEDLGNAGVDEQFGYGLVDAKSAVILATTGGGPEPEPQFEAPNNLTGLPSTSEVSLFWNDNADVEEGFEIEYGVKRRGSVTWAPFAYADADATSLTAAVSPGKYLFRVRAFKDGATSFTAWSNEITLTIEGDAGTGGGGGKGGKGGGKPAK